MSPRDRLEHLDVVLTAGCNLSCSYCYQNAKQPGRHMDWETLRSSLDLLLASRAPERTVCFYGGEPLLRFDLVRQAVDHVERRRTRGRPVRYAIVTNGTLMSEEIARFLAIHRFETQLSFDGVAAAQAHRGARTFPVLDRLLDRLRRDHPAYYAEDLYVLLTLLPSTICHLADSFDYFAGKDIGRICVSPLFTGTAPWRLDQVDDLDRQLARIFARSVEHFDETGRVLFDGFRKDVPDDVHAPAGLSMCGVSTGRTLAVDVDGEVYGCVTFAESYQRYPSELLRSQLAPLRIGPIDAPALEGALRAYPERAKRASILHRKQDKYSSYGTCGTCRYLATCSICPASIGHIPENHDPRRVPDFLCAYSLVLQKYRERFPAQADPRDILTGRMRIPRTMFELRRRDRSADRGVAPEGLASRGSTPSRVQPKGPRRRVLAPDG